MEVAVGAGANCSIRDGTFVDYSSAADGAGRVVGAGVTGAGASQAIINADRRSATIAYHDASPQLFAASI